MKKSENLEYLDFYSGRRAKTYGDAYTAQSCVTHAHYDQLLRFVDAYELRQNKKCLEIGSSGGMFQDVVDDYYGTDVSPELAKHYHKPYRVSEGATYPFEDATFDAIWTFDTFEHIPDLQTALSEVIRLLRPNGLVLFCPAWQCRSWAADGYAVRPYSDFSWGGRIIKASIPLRDSVAWRSMFVFPKRCFRHFLFSFGLRYRTLRYRRLKANYDHFWLSDSDACNSIDPHDAILFFESHGLTCLSHPLHLKALLVRTGGLVFQKCRATEVG